MFPGMPQITSGAGASVGINGMSSNPAPQRRKPCPYPAGIFMERLLAGKAGAKKEPGGVWLLLFIEQCPIDSQLLCRQLINKACSAKFRQGQRFLNSQHRTKLWDCPHGRTGRNARNAKMFCWRERISVKSAVSWGFSRFLVLKCFSWAH